MNLITFALSQERKHRYHLFKFFSHKKGRGAPSSKWLKFVTVYKSVTALAQSAAERTV
jgi:hypothetical protein